MPKHAAGAPGPQRAWPAVYTVDPELHRKLRIASINSGEKLYKLVERILWATVKAWEAEEAKKEKQKPQV